MQVKTRRNTRRRRRGTRDRRIKLCQDVSSTDARNMRCGLERKDQITNRETTHRETTEHGLGSTEKKRFLNSGTSEGRIRLKKTYFSQATLE